MLEHEEINGKILFYSFRASGHQAMEFANLIYSKPYSRIPPYIVGLSLGYFLYNAKKPFGLVKNVSCCCCCC